MAQTKLIIKALKMQLKAQSKTYFDVAEKLNLSEASVKRMFSAQHISLKRLDKVCELLEIEISELIMAMQDNTHHITQLSEKQEFELISDTRLLLVAVSAINRWSMDDIHANYNFERQYLIQCLKRLERIGLLQLLTGYRIRMLVSQNFSWLPDGPIQTYFREKVQNEYFNAAFNQPGEKLRVVTGMISSHSNATLQKRLDKLASEFVDLDLEENHLPIEQRYGTTLVIAMRPWEMQAFESLRRSENKKVFK